MQKRVGSFILATILFLNCFSVFNFSFASNNVNEYIISVDVKSIEPLYDIEFNNKNYLLAREYANKALDIFEEYLTASRTNVEVFDRLSLLMPGLVVKASVNDIESIKSLNYVLNIYDNNKYNEPSELVPVRTRSRRSLSPMSHSIRNDIFKNNSLTGRGSVVSIIDSHMNPNHPAFSDNDSIEAVVTEGLANSLYQGSYFSKKVPFRWNYYAYKIKNNEATEKTNPNGIVNGHGQHVAGIAVGNKMKWGSVDWQGIAPDAQVLMMHQNLEDHIITKSIEDSLVLKADVINLSLGNSFRTYSNKSIMQDAIDKVVNEGIVVSAAAGNDGDLSNLNLSTDNPGFSTLSDPANSDSVIAVASSKNSVEYVNLIEFNINSVQRHFYYEHLNKVPVISGEYKLVENSDDLKSISDSDNVMFTGSVQDYHKLSDKSKVDLILTSSRSSYGVNIPVINADKQMIDTIKKDKTNLNNLTVKFLEPVDSADYGKMSAFSSWGIAPGGSLKPDISAPGDRILSADNNNGLFLEQGTSMAAPVITGTVALFNEYYKNSPFRNLTGKDKSDIIKTVLMNSAIPHKNISPRQQGAGVVDIDKAISLDFTAVDSSNNIASKFVGDVDDSIELNLNIKNWSNIDKRLKARVEILVQENDGNKIKFTSRSAKSYDLEEFDLSKNDQINKTFNINISDVDTSAFKNGAFVDGFLYLNDGTNEISFPFAAFKKAGEKALSDLPAVEKPVYDFDFANERPIHWSKNIVDKESNWHKVSTHIETKGNRIAGMINFDGFKFNNKPLFENLVFSKMNPNANTDLFKPYFVVIRPGKFNTFIENKDTNAKISEENFFVETKNVFSAPLAYKPEIIVDLNGKQVGLFNAGFVEMNAINISNLPDGKYSYKIIANPFDGSTTDIKDFNKYGLGKEQIIEIPFAIDNTAPEFLDQVYEVDSNKFTFKVKDTNGVKDVNINGQQIKPNAQGLYEYILKNGEDINALKVTATDVAHNEKTLNVNQIPEKKANEYNVSFLVDGDIYLAKQIEYGKSVSAPTIPTKLGYEFLGWLDVMGETASFPYKITTDTSFIANWKKLPNKINITFNFNQSILDNKVVTIEEGNKVSEPDFEKIIKVGDDEYEFKGWYLDSEFINLADLSLPFNENKILYAKWQKIEKPVVIVKHKVTFKNDGVTKVVEVEDGGTVSKPTQPIKEGHKFLGWFNGDEHFIFTEKITTELTLVARWEKIEAPKPKPEIEPTPRPNPRPDSRPYEPAPYRPSENYRPNDNYRPSDSYIPSETYRPIAKKDEPKTEIKREEVKTGVEVQQKAILVSAPILPVTLIDIPKNEEGIAINNMIARGVLIGTGENKFEPELTITRAMVTEVFMRIAADKSIEEVMNFNDVKSGDWYENSVKWAADKNIIKGFEDGSFKPNQKVTLQEFATMIVRMLNEYKIEMPTKKVVDAKDYPYLIDWSRDAIQKSVEYGMIEVNSIDDLTREVSRAELAVVLNKIIELVEQK